MGGASPRLSIVVPFFNERDNVLPLHEQIARAVSGLPGGWEAVYVDDGSTDGTWRQLEEARAAHPAHVSLIRLRRNFGQTAALAAGFHHARGAVIVTLDGDQQNDPADIPRLLAELDKGFDVVSGWRRHRKDPLLSRRLPSRMANWLIGWMTGVKLHDHGCTLKAYRREVIEQMTLYGEMHRFLPAQARWVGAKICEISVSHRPRTRGTSKYGLWRTYKVLLDLVTIRFLGVHGTKPLHAFGALGLTFIAAGIATMLALTWLKYSTGVSFIQSPLLLLSAMFVILGGQSILLGLLAEIAVRTYYESQHKPIYIIGELQQPEGREREPAGRMS
jgi:glycosyltransferase involved in cell wall biosynthesis